MAWPRSLPPINISRHVFLLSNGTSKARENAVTTVTIQRRILDAEL